MLSVSIENYLKAIYHFTNKHGERVSTSSIAEALQISNAAISDMAKKLSEKGLLDYQKYKGLELTNEGRQMAMKVIRRHRLWELFLIKVLDLSWDEVHDEAEILEHHTSDFLIDKIDNFLQHPLFDPHGDPIPDEHGNLPEIPEVRSLSDCLEGERYTIARVDDKQVELMRYLTRIGIQLNTEVEIVEHFSFDNSINIKIKDKEFLLSEKVVNSLFVAPKIIA